MAVSDYPDVPNYDPLSNDYPTLLRKLINVIRGIMQGRTNNVYEITLTANSATTTVTLAAGDLGVNSAIFFAPQTANAATEFGAGTLRVSAINSLSNSFTITHVNNAQTDRTFKYIIVG